jgi:serine-type D-Ala-D-Ala carboxypeptidase (penicillin-binding protein 5/6)
VIRGGLRPASAYYQRDRERLPSTSPGGVSRPLRSDRRRSSSQKRNGSPSSAPRRRARSRRWPLVVAVAILIVVAAVVVRLMTLKLPNLVLRVSSPSTVRLSGSAPVPAWPVDGQAALVVPGIGSLGSAGGDEPRPTASLAKVMTAYLTLKEYPLSPTGGGFTLTVTPTEARAEAEDARQDESVVAVRAGERLDERQLLEGLLIPSGDNIARMLAAYDAGSVPRFVTEMNRTARALGMDRTTYTDPSGYDPATVSDASDQLRVFERAIGFGVIRQIVSMPSVTLPVAGTVGNYNPLIAEGYDGKTGSDSEAAGCLAFFKHFMVDGRTLTVVGVVLGQGTGRTTSVILAAAAAAAERLVGSVTSAIRARTVLSAGTRVMVASAADGRWVAGVTANPLRVIAWGGLREHLAFRLRSIGADLTAGQPIGEGALTGTLPAATSSRTHTAVRTRTALAPPGILWRLAHLL